jgi:hypothetical protein
MGEANRCNRPEATGDVSSLSLRGLSIIPVDSLSQPNIAGTGFAFSRAGYSHFKGLPSF